MKIFKRNEREESEELFEQLQGLAGEREEIHKRKVALLGDHETRDLFLTLLVAGHFLQAGDPFLAELQAKAENLKRAEMEKERAWNVRDREVRRLLQALTAPVIEKAVEKLKSSLQTLKAEKNVLDENPNWGINMRPRLEIETNEPAIAEIQKLLYQGIETLQGMSLRPIFEIENFLQEKLAQIQEIDLSVQRKVVDKISWRAREWAVSPRT